MVKFENKKPTNVEIGKRIDKKESTIRAFKKNHPEKIEQLELEHKEATYPFLNIKEYLQAINLDEPLSEKDLLNEIITLSQRIEKKELPGTIYIDGNKFKHIFIPAIIDRLEGIKDFMNDIKIQLPITISIGNHKGGAIKTTNTTNIAASLAYFGYKVLIVDFDPQGNASGSFGIYEGDYKYTIVDLLTMSADKDIEHKVKESVININMDNTFENGITGKLDILANNATMSEQVEDLPSMTRHIGTIENTLDRVLSYIKNDYDFILIDLPPRTDVILRTSMIASDYFLVSLNTQPFAKMGMPNILNPINKYKHVYKQEKNKDFIILGGIVACHESGVSIQDANYNQMKEDILTCTDNKTSLFDTYIPKASVIPESQQGDGAVIFNSPTSKITRKYFDLTLEILERLAIEKDMENNKGLN
ncbi:MAG: hypothetical protein COA66_10280 [Arcobacter sp.]|nr:MAG: hypothetical protein COA66_10280 [Arcobacter sp.]